MAHELLLKTRRFNVERRTYAQIGSAPVVREVAVHAGAAVILPLLDDERIVMIRNYRWAVEEELLELPAGTLESDEPPATTAARELEEETGYRAGLIEPLAEFFPSPGVFTERMYAYVARNLEQTQQRLEATEKITPEIVSKAEARAMLKERRLRDGKTIAVLGMYFAGENC